MNTVRETSSLPINVPRIISGSFIVAGTAIGAGMLGIPFMTAKAGYLGAVLVTTAVWLFMLFTGLLYIEVTLQMPRGSNILSIAKRYLGDKASLFVGFMFLFLYYCFMIAYFSGGGSMFQEIFLQWFGLSITTVTATVAFAFLLSVVIFFGARAVDRSNLVLMAAMIVFYILLISVGFQGTKVPVNSSLQWVPMVAAIPMLFGAFGFHNVIPSLCDYFDKDRKSLHFSVILGTTLALVVYLIWQAIIFHNIPLPIISETLEGGKSLVFALQQALPEQKIATFATYFSMCALATSVLGVGLSLIDFLKDSLATIGKKASRAMLILLAFFPPLVLCLTNETIFYKALAWAGGFGESFLNGALPILLVWVGRYIFKEEPMYRVWGEKGTLSLFMISAIGVMIIEVLSSFHIL